MSLRGNPCGCPPPERSTVVSDRDTSAPQERLPGPDRPTQLTRRSWWGVLKRTVKQFQQDNLTDWSAALTYYGILALFPALLVLVSLVGLFGGRTTDAVIANITALTPGS